MSVLVCRGLEEVHRGEIARPNRSKKVINVIIVVRKAVVSDFSDGRGPNVRRIGRRRLVLEESVVRNVIVRRPSKACRAPVAARSAVGVSDSQVKTTHKRSPTYACSAEQISDVLSFHAHHRTSRAGVSQWIGIADNRERSGSPFRDREGCGHTRNLTSPTDLPPNALYPTRSTATKPRPNAL